MSTTYTVIVATVMTNQGPVDLNQQIVADWFTCPDNGGRLFFYNGVRGSGNEHIVAVVNQWQSILTDEAKPAVQRVEPQVPVLSLRDRKRSDS